VLLLFFKKKVHHAAGCRHGACRRRAPVRLFATLRVCGSAPLLGVLRFPETSDPRPSRATDPSSMHVHHLSNEEQLQNCWKVVFRPSPVVPSYLPHLQNEERDRTVAAPAVAPTVAAFCSRPPPARILGGSRGLPHPNRPAGPPSPIPTSPPPPSSPLRPLPSDDDDDATRGGAGAAGLDSGGRREARPCRHPASTSTAVRELGGARRQCHRHHRPRRGPRRRRE
jgi:hypothetical protein